MLESMCSPGVYSQGTWHQFGQCARGSTAGGWGLLWFLDLGIVQSRPALPGCGTPSGAHWASAHVQLRSLFSAICFDRDTP